VATDDGLATFKHFTDPTGTDFVPVIAIDIICGHRAAHNFNAASDAFAVSDESGQVARRAVGIRRLR